MKISDETKVLLSILGVTVLAVVGAVFIFSRPAPQYTLNELISETTPLTGKMDAPVVLVEFSDFQCPACKAFQPILNDIMKTYGSQVALAYRHYPLAQHPYARNAAIAAEAAKIQGKFWEMHDALFTNQDTLSDETVQTIVKDLKLDEASFSAALVNPAIQETIQNDIVLGDKLKIKATPTFFLNGHELTLGSYESLKTAVETALKSK